MKHTGKKEQRTILGQILSLSHYPNKLAMRHQFDFDAPDQKFQLLNTIDDILSNLADKLIIQYRCILF